MTQVRVTPNNRINVVETKAEIKGRMRRMFEKYPGGFLGLTQITLIDALKKETGNIEEEILINIDHIISIY